MSKIWGYPTSRHPPPSPPSPPSWELDVFTFTAPPLKNGREGRKDGGQGQQRRLSFSSFHSSPHIFFFSQQCRYPRPKRGRPLADVDGEGTEAVQKMKKKRRLRLSFVTSRLSRPFSFPPTHIITRGSSKIAIWAKQKALRRSSLRRAAIMNRLRKNALSTREAQPHRFEMARWTFMYDYLITPSSTEATAVTTSPATAANITAAANATYPSLSLPPPTHPPPRHPPTADQLTQIDKLISQSGSQPSCLRPSRRRRSISPSPSPPSPQSSPRKQYIPLPSSPLSLTNYDIFDNEDGYFDSSDGESSDDDCGGGSNNASPQNGRTNDNSNSNDNSTNNNNKKNKKKHKGSRVYSDFNVLEPSESVIEEDHDSLSAFDSLPFWGRWLPEVGGSGEDEKDTEMRLERERQKEVSFVKFEV